MCSSLMLVRPIKFFTEESWALYLPLIIVLFYRKYFSNFLYWFVCHKNVQNKGKKLFDVMARKPKRSHQAYKEWAPSVKIIRTKYIIITN